MEQNFFERYKDYSTIDLLKILKQPGKYQQAAVDAATKILGQREVLQTEIEAADHYFQDLDNKAKAKTEKLNLYKDKAADFLEPVLNPGTEIKPTKWLNILLLVIGLQYTWTLYEIIRDLILLISCNDCEFDPVYLFMVANLVFIPVIFYLLLKRKRWGWILLFGDNLLALIIKLFQLLIFFNSGGFGISAPGIYLFIICLKLLFVIFLWRNDISAFFNINATTKKQTVIIVALIALVYTLIMLLPIFYA